MTGPAPTSDRRMDAEGLLSRSGRSASTAALRAIANSQPVANPRSRRCPAAARQTLVQAYWTTSSLPARSPTRRTTTAYTALP